MAETVEEIEARRAERKAETKRKFDAQKVKDLAELEKLEAEHGDELIDYIELERYADGFPVLVVVRMPKPGEFKRYQQRCSSMQKNPFVATEAANELGLVCALYPAREALQQLDELRNGVIAAAGVAAARMTGAKVREEGKG
jgi:hypothetical protein